MMQLTSLDQVPAALRPDYLRSNALLIAFYGRNGFNSVDSASAMGWTEILMERPS